ncbi:MAG: NUDIX hydrolase [Patescibacteria group bacterium]
MRLNLPPDEYYAQLTKVPTSGGAIFRNSKGEFLIIKKTYGDKGWSIPGGMTDQHENPREAVLREIQEELGLHLKQARLFCVDFAKNPPYDRILFVFDCGILDDQMISSIRIDTDEIGQFKFVPQEEMFMLLGPKIKKRLENSLEHLFKSSCVYLESGEKTS